MSKERPTQLIKSFHLFLAPEEARHGISKDLEPLAQDELHIALGLVEYGTSTTFNLQISRVSEKKRNRKSFTYERV